MGCEFLLVVHKCTHESIAIDRILLSSTACRIDLDANKKNKPTFLFYKMYFGNGKASVSQTRSEFDVMRFQYQTYVIDETPKEIFPQFMLIFLKVRFALTVVSFSKVKYRLKRKTHLVLSSGV